MRAIGSLADFSREENGIRRYSVGISDNPPVVVSRSFHYMRRHLSLLMEMVTAVADARGVDPSKLEYAFQGFVNVNAIEQ